MPPEWRRALDDLVAAPVTIVIGAAEAGKTTFTAWLATALHARGYSVGIVDADVGQTEIGPPTTIGLGRVAGPLTRPADAEVVAFEFVGVTSPARRPTRVVDATARLSTRARQEFQRVVVDTSGFVAAGFGAAVKQRKILAVDPDLVVVVERREEMAHLLRALTSRGRPRVVRLPALEPTHPRSAAARRRHRDAALAHHLEGAQLVALDARRVAVNDLTGDAMPLADVSPGAVAGLYAADGATMALGVVHAVDARAGQLVVRTTRSAAEIAAITIGETMAA